MGISATVMLAARYESLVAVVLGTTVGMTARASSYCVSSNYDRDSDIITAGWATASEA